MFTRAAGAARALRFVLRAARAGVFISRGRLWTGTPACPLTGLFDFGALKQAVVAVGLAIDSAHWGQDFGTGAAGGRASTTSAFPLALDFHTSACSPAFVLVVLAVIAAHRVYDSRTRAISWGRWGGSWGRGGGSWDGRAASGFAACRKSLRANWDTAVAAAELIGVTASALGLLRALALACNLDLGTGGFARIAVSLPIFATNGVILKGTDTYVLRIYGSHPLNKGTCKKPSDFGHPNVFRE